MKVCPVPAATIQPAALHQMLILQCVPVQAAIPHQLYGFGFESIL